MIPAWQRAQKTLREQAEQDLPGPNYGDYLFLPKGPVWTSTSIPEEVLRGVCVLAMAVESQEPSP